MRLRKGRTPAPPLQGPEAFGAFYEENWEDLLVFFARRVLDPEVALDLTAETFAQALLSRRRFRGATNEEARSWLYGIARHQLSDYWRRGQAEKRALRRAGLATPRLSDEDHERIEELAGTARLRAAARNGLSELSAAEREAIRLRVVDELSYEEVASSLSITEDAARARVSRGLRTLARKLETAGVGEG
jgi:RNA polymerase sigma-70 factor (ECF subfamily)